jgi:uncharacterized protein YndB with AHSA1/START domain
MKPYELTVARVIPAPAADLFDVYLDPKSPGGPWFRCARLIFDAKVDGLFHHAVEHEGRTWPHYGRFIAIERPRLIEHTWVSEATRGAETIVSVTFEPREGGTEVTLRHRVSDAEMGRAHEGGWTLLLSMLAKRFGAA